MNLLLEKNKQLNTMIKKTNESYKNLIISINDNNEFISTIDSLLKLDSETIKIIKPSKYTNIKSNIYDKYEFVGNCVYSKFYIKNKEAFKQQDKGKWMLFGTVDELLEYWKIIRLNTYNNELGYFSKFIGDEKGKVISIYFTNYDDKNKILEYGNKIKKLVDYNNSIYFKPCHMTKNKQYGLGSWLYKIDADVYEFVN